MAKTPATQLTLKRLRADGWPMVEKTEHWNTHAGVTNDLFGFVDVLAVGPRGTLAVQTTSATNVSSRVKKIRGDKRDGLDACLAAGWSVVVHGWEKNDRGHWALKTEVHLGGPVL